MLVSISLETAPEPNFAVPASALTGPESLIKAVPSARQKASVSSVSTRLHWGQRFIFGVWRLFIVRVEFANDLQLRQSSAQTLCQAFFSNDSLKSNEHARTSHNS